MFGQSLSGPGPAKLACPKSLKWHTAGHVAEVFVGGQHRQIVANTQLRQEGVDRSDLNSGAAAAVAKFGRVHMIAPIGNEKRKGGKAIDDCRRALGPANPWSNS